ncbi:uncharacterized protein EI90DRAFT_3015134 [Cantharellus anzutake]|uniref:uncharacterized protein n=1 Tax=Cantharellus anzutake TaxID=1750568 RepID=UPI001903B1F6|nr:uncharacterized protein EI90DRAFT_3015134 [Cantharellus anzutake]KAF8334085.1 hypothetical protein EI90DRAFT_3015134 [Cantharellus anzutake]
MSLHLPLLRIAYRNLRTQHFAQAQPLDCLRTSPHSSHFGLLQALLTAHRLRPPRTYLVGFGHELTHAEWTLIGETLHRFSAPEPVDDSKGVIVKTLEEMSFDESWEASGGGVRKRMMNRP